MSVFTGRPARRRPPAAVPADGPGQAGLAGSGAVFAFALETLGDAHDRGFCFTADQALLALSRSSLARGHVIAADPWRSLPVTLVRKAMSRDRTRVALTGVTSVRPMRWRRRDPVRVPSLRRSYARYDRVLERQAKRWGLEHPPVLTFNPFVAAFCPLEWASTITYYASDDWAVFPAASRLWPAYREAYRAICERGARIICVSEELAARVTAGAAPAVVVPNGVDEILWLKPGTPPLQMLGLARPIIAYIGAIDRRLDTELITRMAGDEAVGSVALIGPIADAGVSSKIRSLRKVVHCGVMSRAGVAGALAHSDVGVIPHVVDDLTDSMSPLKLYEYLAAGKPVVSTRLAGVRASERVIVSSREDFPAGVRAAIQLGTVAEEERLRFVRLNSWAARHARTLRVMCGSDSEWWRE